jgi:DNA polymerase elongation subunit (family B)
MQFLVLDIEAVVDPDVWVPPPPPSNWKVGIGDSPASIVAASGRLMSGIIEPAAPEAFPPPFAWRPICVGAVLLEDVSDSTVIHTKHIGVMEELLAGTDVAAIERSVLGVFARTMARTARQCLITWNGRRYDLPVLIQRSMRYAIPQPWYFGNRDVRYRYTEDGHCDLADAIADYGGAPMPKLDGVAKLIGLPGKFGDIDGARVGEAFAAGRLRDIGTYCMSDAVQTAFIWLRWQALKGNLTPNAYRASAEELLNACAITERLVEFTKLVDRRVLLLEDAAVQGAA